MKVQTIMIAIVALVAATTVAANAIEPVIPESISQLVLWPLAAGLFACLMLVLAEVVLPRLSPRWGNPAEDFLSTIRIKRQVALFLLGFLVFKLSCDYWESGFRFRLSDVADGLRVVAVFAGMFSARLVVNKFGLSPEPRPERHW